MKLQLAIIKPSYKKQIEEIIPTVYYCIPTQLRAHRQRPLTTNTYPLIKTQTKTIHVTQSITHHYLKTFSHRAHLGDNPPPPPPVKFTPRPRLHATSRDAHFALRRRVVVTCIINNVHRHNKVREFPCVNLNVWETKLPNWAYAMRNEPPNKNVSLYRERGGGGKMYLQWSPIPIG